MEHISKATEQALDKSRRGSLSNAVLRQPNAASTLEIGIIITELEFRTQLKPLDELQRKELIELLYDLNEPKEKIQQRANSVMLQETYGTIAFKYWVGDLVCTRSEVDAMKRHLQRSFEAKQINHELEIKCELDRRLEEYRHTLADPSELGLAELEAVESAVEAYRLHETQKATKLRAKTKRRIAFARQQICSLDNNSRQAILEEAVRRKKIKTFDGSMVKECPALAYALYEVIEDASFMQSVSGSRQ